MKSSRYPFLVLAFAALYAIFSVKIDLCAQDVPASADAASAFDAVSFDAASAASNFAAWLPDFGSSDPKVMEAAQQNWQRVCMAAGASENQALRSEVNRLMTEQLDVALDAVAKTWLLYQLRWTAEEAQIPAVARRLDDEDVRVRGAAARVLATLGTPTAVGALEAALSTVAEEHRAGIEQILRVVRYDYAVPTESQPPQNLPYVDDAQVEQWLAGIDTLSTDDRCRTLAALTERRDRRCRALALAALEGSDENLRRAGLLAFEKVGEASDLPILLEKIDDSNCELTLRVLSLITDERMNGEILAMMIKIVQSDSATKTNGERFRFLADLAAARSITESLDTILAGANRWPNERAYLLSKTEELATGDDIGKIVDSMLTVRNVADREQVERMVTRLVRGQSEEITRRITPRNRAELLPCLGRIGDDAAWEQVERSLTGGTAREKAAAFRALCNWPNAARSDQLLAFAENQKLSEAERVAALRAYIRVVTLPKTEIGIEADDATRLTMLKKAFELAERDDERRLAVERLSSIRTPEALTFARAALNDPKYSEAAIGTILELAHHDFLRKGSPEEFKEALDAVMASAKHQSEIDRAKKYRAMMP